MFFLISLSWRLFQVLRNIVKTDYSVSVRLKFLVLIVVWSSCDFCLNLFSLTNRIVSLGWLLQLFMFFIIQVVLTVLMWMFATDFWQVHSLRNGDSINFLFSSRDLRRVWILVVLFIISLPVAWLSSDSEIVSLRKLNLLDNLPPRVPCGNELSFSWIIFSVLAFC